MCHHQPQAGSQAGAHQPPKSRIRKSPAAGARDWGSHGAGMAKEGTVWTCFCFVSTRGGAHCGLVTCADQHNGDCKLPATTASLLERSMHCSLCSYFGLVDGWPDPSHGCRSPSVPSTHISG